MSVSEPVDLIATSESKPKPKPKPTPKKNPNALMMLFRKYHTWFGLFAAGFVVMIALTGIYLNHKNTFQFLLPEGKTTTEHIGPSGKMGIPTGEEIAALPMSMQQALEQATPHLQDRPIEKIELRSEHGKLVYKVKSIEGPEAVIDVYTRELEIKGDKKPVNPKEQRAKTRSPRKKSPNQRKKYRSHR